MLHYTAKCLFMHKVIHIWIFDKICRAPRKRLRYNLPGKYRHMIFLSCFEMLLQKLFFSFN
ncbi:hypothetical protein XNC3_2890001 [Xenorhabdus nematophila F1]|nr:hypothetical protein XNC3_2890001 [Xenorhabdus nematophila F1]